MKKYALFLIFSILISFISCKSPISDKTFKGNGLLSNYSFKFQDDKFYFYHNDQIVHQGTYKKDKDTYILKPENLYQTLEVKLLNNAICYNNTFYFFDSNSPFATFQIFDKTFVNTNQNANLKNLSLTNLDKISYNLDNDIYFFKNISFINDILSIDSETIKLIDNQLVDNFNNVFYESPLENRYFQCSWILDDVYFFSLTYHFTSEDYVLKSALGNILSKGTYRYSPETRICTCIDEKTNYESQLKLQEDNTLIDDENHILKNLFSFMSNYYITDNNYSMLLSDWSFIAFKNGLPYEAGIINYDGEVINYKLKDQIYKTISYDELEKLYQNYTNKTNKGDN